MISRRALWVAAVTAGLTGCQCGGGSTDAGVPGRVISVVRTRTLVNGADRVEVPFDLSEANQNSNLSLLVDDDDGGYRVINPEGKTDGTAVFRGVPDGSYLVSLNGYRLQSDEASLDLGIVDLGRDGPLTDGGTVLGLAITGLTPWVDFADVLQLTSAQAGYVSVNLQAFAATPPDGGASEANLDIEYLNACATQRARFAPLIDTGAGDELTLTQLSTSDLRSDAGTLLAEVRRLLRSTTFSSATVLDHQRTALTAALTAPASTGSATLDLRLSDFDQARALVHPNAVASSTTVALSVLPFTADEGLYTATGDLAVLVPQVTKTDLRVQLDYGNPYPASWPQVGAVRYETSVNYAFPDGGSRSIPVVMLTSDLLPAFVSGPIRPQVTPPTSVMIDGVPSGSAGQISPTPTLSWAAPGVGTPTSYGVTVYQLSRVGTGPVIRLSEEGFYETVNRQLKLPLGQLEPGGQYVFGVSAIMAPGTSPTRAPFKTKLPYHSATGLTALIQVRP